MKAFFLISLICLIPVSFAASKSWVLIAETTDCSGKIKILAKEGESFVYALRDQEKLKLNSADGSAFVRDNKNTVLYNSEPDAQGDKITFLQPSFFQSTPPEIKIISANKNGQDQRCKMNSK